MGDSTHRPAVARDLGDGWVGVWVAYADRLSAKTLPGSKWDPGLSCWRVPDKFASEADALVEQLNSTIDPLEQDLTSLIGRLPHHLAGATCDVLSNIWWDVPRLSQILDRVRARFDLEDRER